MDRFLIVTNDGKDADHIITRKVKELLETEARNASYARRMKRRIL